MLPDNSWENRPRRLHLRPAYPRRRRPVRHLAPRPPRHSHQPHGGVADWVNFFTWEVWELFVQGQRFLVGERPERDQKFEQCMPPKR